MNLLPAPSRHFGRARCGSALRWCRPRTVLCVELLEDRTLLALAAGSFLPIGDHPYTSKEVVASIRSGNPLAELASVLGQETGRSLSSLIDLEATQKLYGRNGNATVQIGLKPGVDPVTVVRQLQRLPHVQWASPNFIYDTGSDPRDFEPNDPLYALQYHHPLMQNDRAWDITLGDPRIVIAITDDGVDLRHDDLSPNIWINQGEIPVSRRANLIDVDGDGFIDFLDLNYQDPKTKAYINQGPFKIMSPRGDNHILPLDLLAPLDRDTKGKDLGTGGWATGEDKDGNGYIDDIVGWSTIDNTNNPQPRPGYSHGTHVAGIAAARTDNAIGVAGTAGHARIMPIRFYGNGAWTSTVIARSYAYAADNGARIVSTSYNVDGFVDDPIFRDGLQYMYDAGVLHFNSAGNNTSANPPRQKLDTTLYVVSTNQNDRKSDFSNWGWGVDISAPGENIYSTFPNNNYGFDSGTSMASPNAAGVAALIWSLHPNWTRDQVAAQLLGTADNIDDLNPTQCRGSCAGQLGAGRVNAYRGLTETLAPPRFRSLQGLPEEGESTGASITTFQIDVASVFDPATINDRNNWELRAAGPNGVFDTDDDVIVPLTLQMTVGDTYEIGTNRLYFSVDSALEPGYYRFRAKSGGLRDPFGTPLDGSGSGKGGDPFDRTFYVTAGGAGAPSASGARQFLVASILSAELRSPGLLPAAGPAGTPALSSNVIAAFPAKDVETSASLGSANQRAIAGALNLGGTAERTTVDRLFADLESKNPPLLFCDAHSVSDVDGSVFECVLDR